MPDCMSVNFWSSPKIFSCWFSIEINTRAQIIGFARAYFEVKEIFQSGSVEEENGRTYFEFDADGVCR